MTAIERKWWRDGVCYQVWPASFKDSNDDGLGDIPGVISKLDYLRDLGVDFIWLSPMYDSPQKDCGYDISDYQNVYPPFGTMQDMDNLISGLHQRDMKIILDLVVNHTSDEHKWFQESAKSRDNKFSDYYIWRDPKYVAGKRVEPSNVASVFGGSAWKYVEARDQYFFHVFLDSQPDLNWEMLEVRRAIYQTAIKFWLDRGVDGFRVDAVNLYSKNTAFPDAKVKDEKDLYHGPEFKEIVNGPKMHEWLREQRREAFDPYGDIVLVGELGFSPEEEMLRYINPQHRELDMVFDFELMMLQEDADISLAERIVEYNVPRLRSALSRPQRAISQHGCWSTVFLENHDQPRGIDRFAPTLAELRVPTAKLIALLLTTLSGTLFIYQGQEIAMSGIKDWPIADMRDKWWLAYFKEVERKHPGDANEATKARKFFEHAGRDHARTPEQWSSGPNAGFTTGQPWMRVNENFGTGINVAEQEQNSDSVLNFWKSSIAFRKAHADALIYGSTEWLEPANGNVLVYRKTGASEKLLVVLNWSEKPEGVSAICKDAKFIFGTYGQEMEKLAPKEGRVYSIS